MTIDEIKKMLDSGEITPSNESLVKTGVLQANDSRNVEYQLHHGWDVAKAYACDNEWGKFNVELMRFIESKKYDEKQLAEILEQIQIDDAHWKWFDKSFCYKQSDYDWFFLMAENIPQGVCLIYHPKPSVLEDGDIFYIEYVASAPWNRVNPMRPQIFKKIGSILIKYAIDYAHTVLKLRYGFSLHALPKAAAFYHKIGMTEHPPYAKEGLQYFEMIEQRTTDFVEA